MAHLSSEEPRSFAMQHGPLSLDHRRGRRVIVQGFTSRRGWDRGCSLQYRFPWGSPLLGQSSKVRRFTATASSPRLPNLHPFGARGVDLRHIGKIKMRSSAHGSIPQRFEVLRLVGFGAVTLATFALLSACLETSVPSSRQASVEGDERGRAATVPETIPLKGLRDVFYRVVGEVGDDRVTLIAAGVTFYLLLSLFPALAAFVALYGLVADPSAIAENFRSLSALLPPGAYDLIASQLEALVKARNGSLGIAFVVSFAIALWSAHSGTLSIFDSMNVAYEETEKRGVIRLNLIAVCFTLLAITAAITLLGLVAVLPLVFSYMWLDHWKENLVLLARWPVLALGAFIAISAIYRFGPSREPARFRWLTWGAGFATIGCFGMSFAFSLYLSNVANYNATYGTLGALMGLLMWIWLSVVILIVGAEINAELEHQTEKDTTTGTPVPMGMRGAYVADTIGEAKD
jgi:membrane protein